jgi:penicillin-binding protein 1A
VYAAAIATRRYTVATIIPDAPLVFKTVGPDLWKPENYGEDYLGDITLRRALAMSRNVVTIRVLDSIKLPVVVDMARKVGIVSKMDEDLSMGLGAASLTMPEMATAYTTFSTLGKKVDPHYINSVSDRDNNILEQWTQLEWPQAIDASVAGVMTWLLQEVASNGTAAKAQGLGLHVAGTTNDFRDAWFVGFTPGVTTAVWVGYDQPRSIGNSATGGTIALPIWMDYMRVAVPTSTDRPFPAAPGLSWVGIDDKSGRAIKGGRSMPFLSGTAPAETDMEADQKTSQDLLTTEF